MSWLTSFAIQAVVALLVAVAFDAALYFLPRKTSEPPAISHWIPWIGSAVSYGRNPCRFLMDCQKKVPFISPVTTRPCSSRATDNGHN